MDPLLITDAPLPLFSKVNVEDIETTLQQILNANQKQIAQIITQEHYHWDNLVQPLEEMQERLHKYWSIVQHLHAVADNPLLRAAYNKCLPQLTAYYSEWGHNTKLYQAYQKLAQSEAYPVFNQAQKQVIKHAVRDFRLAGVALEGGAKEQHKQLSQKLASLTARFEENVLDATHAWYYHTTDVEKLQGIPAHAMAIAQQMAQAKGLSGWVFTLDFPSYYSVISYADNRELREQFYTAYVTRASELSSQGLCWDNSAVMEAILASRHEIAQLLAYNNYAEYSLVTKMAKTPQQVLDFLTHLAQQARPVAEKEWDTLKQFAKQKYEHNELAAWDIAYYSEKLCKFAYAIDQEELRPYFPESQVLHGLFQLVHTFWDPNVKADRA